MATSMTGFGTASGSIGSCNLLVEVRSVNNRFLDLQQRLPKVYSSLEPCLREEVLKRATRGRVEISVQRLEATVGSDNAIFNDHLYNWYLQQLSSKVGSSVRDLERSVSTVLALFQQRGVIGWQEGGVVSEEELLLVKSTVSEALSSWQTHRATEGAVLAQDILDRVTKLEAALAAIREQLPQLQRQGVERAQRRIKELFGESGYSEEKLYTELVLRAERSDFAEELTRAFVHLEGVQKALEEAQCGRRIEFLAQELNRELTTGLAKSNDPTVSQSLVECKLLAEQIREQCQNLE